MRGLPPPVVPGRAGVRLARPQRCAFLLLLLTTVAVAHPYHLSVTELVYDRDSERFRGTMRVSARELERTLRARLEEPLRLEEREERLDAPLLALLRERFVMRPDGGEPLPLTLEGWEVGLHSVRIAVSLPSVFPASGLEVGHSLFFGAQPTQQNLVRVTVEGAEQSLLCHVMEPVARLTLRPPPLTPVEEVREAGERGPALVLLADLGCPAEVFDGFLERHRERYRMAAISLPGVVGPAPEGLAEDWRSGAWLAHAERAVHLWVRERGWEAVVVLGHGLGAELATRLAARFPQRFAGAIAVDGWHPLALAGLGAEQRERLVAQVAERQAELDDEAWRKQRAQAVRSWVRDPDRGAALARLVAATPRPVLRRYQLEWLASAPDAGQRSLEGRLLNVVATVPADELAAFGEAPRVVLEGCGHGVMDDAPGALDAAVAEHLERLFGE